MNLQTQGIIAHVLVAFFWGVAAPLVKMALNQGLAPFTFVFLRMALALLILFPFFLLRIKEVKFAKSDIPDIFLIGILGITLNIGFYFVGLSLTSVTDASVLVATTSIFTTLAAIFFLKEKVGRLTLLGILLSFSGTVVIIIQPILENGLFRLENILGNLLILLAVLAWVGYTVINKEVSSKYDSLVLTYFSFFIGLLTFFPFAARDILNPSFYFSLTPFLIFAIGFETLFATIFSYFLFIWGLKYISATTSGIISYLNPIIAISVSILFLGEKLTLPFVMGATLVATGLFLAEMRHPGHPLHHLHKKE